MFTSYFVQLWKMFTTTGMKCRDQTPRWCIGQTWRTKPKRRRSTETLRWAWTFAVVFGFFPSSDEFDAALFGTKKNSGVSQTGNLCWSLGFRYNRCTKERKENKKRWIMGEWCRASERCSPLKIKLSCCFIFKYKTAGQDKVLQMPLCFRAELSLIVSSKRTSWCTPTRRWTSSNKRWANKPQILLTSKRHIPTVQGHDRLLWE